MIETDLMNTWFNSTENPSYRHVNPGTVYGLTKNPVHLTEFLRSASNDYLNERLHWYKNYLELKRFHPDQARAFDEELRSLPASKRQGFKRKRQMQNASPIPSHFDSKVSGGSESYLIDEGALRKAIGQSQR